jgi:mannan endo-1,4-beta-mannosidase
LAYGNGWTADSPNGRTSDVSDSLSSKDLPGIFGWDIGQIETGSSRIINWIELAKLKQWIKQVYDMGSVNTICWHANNPVFGSGAGDGTTVAKILDGVSKPNGSSITYEETFKSWLTTIATFFNNLKGSDGKLIPIIFRPFHECNVQNCFWWDANHCLPSDYIKLWRLTVTHLKDVCNVHNVLYAFSLNDGFTQNDFNNLYPDNGFVDIIGFDAYQRPGTSSSQYITKIQTQTDAIIALAQARNKIPAITEMGCNNLKSSSNQTYTNWFTQTLKPAIKDRLIAYFILWRNPKGVVLGDSSEFYCCYPTHSTQTDFNIFYKEPEFIFSKSTKRKGLYTV